MSVLVLLILFVFWILSFLKLFSQKGGLVFFLKHFLPSTAIFAGLIWLLLVKGDDLEGMGNIIILTPIIALFYLIWSIFVFYKAMNFNRYDRFNEDILDKD